MRFGKAREASFRDFMTVKMRYFGLNRSRESALARRGAKAEPEGQEKL
jgi:hypothetical protein